jgi:hypothetical protein
LLSSTTATRYKVGGVLHYYKKATIKVASNSDEHHSPFAGAPSPFEHTFKNVVRGKSHALSHALNQMQISYSASNIWSLLQFYLLGTLLPHNYSATLEWLDATASSPLPNPPDLFRKTSESITKTSTTGNNSKAFLDWSVDIQW